MRERKWPKVCVLAAMALTFAAAACSDTWEGVKEDTKENVETTTQGVQNAKENIEKKVE